MVLEDDKMGLENRVSLEDACKELGKRVRHRMLKRETGCFPCPERREATRVEKFMYNLTGYKKSLVNYD
ncbi:hypothetical protein CL618_00520 [archaeon]|nr:hypothetical protein [archaeon]